MERAASGDDVSPSQQQLQLVTKPTAAGSVNPMEDMQSWLKANIPQAQVFVNVNYSIKNSSVRFEPAGAGNSTSQDSTQLAASAALDTNPPPPAPPSQGPLHSILSSRKITASSSEGSNAKNNNNNSNGSNKKKMVLIHAR